MKPEIILIAALTTVGRVIGQNGKLPWPKIPEDMARFRSLTLGHPVIMGRKTWEFDLEQHPLPQRCNIVISASHAAHDSGKWERRSLESDDSGLYVVPSFTEALQLVQSAQKIFIIGGATVYTQALPIADTLELTLIDQEYKGDTFFPDEQAIAAHQFQRVQESNHSGYRFQTYHRQLML
jgi:dihydrofolate reductase